MAHEGLWERVLGLEREQTAQRAKCQYLRNPGRYIITLLNSRYVVNLSNREIFCLDAEPARAAEFLEQLCLLAYLINAQDVPISNRLVRAEALPGGQFFFRGLHGLPTQKLEQAFGDYPEILYRIAEPFGAKKCEFGDASIELNVLPRVPVTIVVWRKDEEFEARASILFDQSAASQLPLDALSAVVNLTVEALVKAAAEIR